MPELFITSPTTPNNFRLQFTLMMNDDFEEMTSWLMLLQVLYFLSPFWKGKQKERKKEEEREGGKKGRGKGRKEEDGREIKKRKGRKEARKEERGKRNPVYK